MNSHAPLASADPVFSRSRRGWLKRAGVAAAATAFGFRLAAAPAGVGAPRELTAAQKAALRRVLNDAIARRAFPGGSLVLLSRGQVVFREGFGRVAFDDERAFTTELPCFLASVSKPISATCFVMLAERGVFSLDDPVERHLPAFKGIRLKGTNAPATQPMRIWHLLSHRSGLPSNADMGDARPGRARKSADGTGGNDKSGLESFTSLEQVIEHWSKDGLLAEPGARFGYGGSGYMVAARIAEVILGQRFERILQETLLDPAGMKSTTFHPDAATLAQTPARYQSTPNGPQRDARLPLPRPEGLINPGGGLCSRLDDVAAFLALHLDRGLAGGRRIVAEESLARMYRPHPPRAREAADGGGVGYGLGWNVQSAAGAVRHLGASGTLAWLDVKRQHGGALLTQVKWGPGNRPIIPRLMKEVQGIFAE